MALGGVRVFCLDSYYFNMVLTELYDIWYLFGTRCLSLQLL